MNKAYLTVVLALSFAALNGCNTDKILEVTDPDIINPEQVNSAEGAERLRIGVINRLTQATSGPPTNYDSPFFLGALITDEYRASDTFTDRTDVDRRAIQTSNAILSNSFKGLHRARVNANHAITALKTYSPTRTAEIARMYWVRGFMENQSGETYCNGQIFSSFETNSGALVFGNPVPYTDAFNMAVASFDSAMALSTGSDTASVTVYNAAAVGKARALVNLGGATNFAAAAALVAAVPSSFRYQITHSQTTIDNQWWNLAANAARYNLANSEGTNGLNFATAADPRLPVCGTGLPTSCTGIATTTSADGSLPRYVNRNYVVRTAAVTISSGVEARLIQAEAAINGGDITTFLPNIQAARTALGMGTAATDPGTASGRVDLLFRERAFSLFATGHRLGDMRRLIRQYSRGAETVFPTGAYVRLPGQNYGTDVNLPIPITEANNPNYAGCTDRLP